MKYLLRIADFILTTLLVLVIISATYLGIASRRSTDSIPTAFGQKVLTVLSGSMAPAIHTGDVIIVRPLAPGEPVNVGDIITYRVLGQAHMLITHRVIGIVNENGVPTGYITKGDSNRTQDGTAIQPKQVVGRYRWRVPYFGYVSSFIHTSAGIVLVVILPGVILIALEIRRLWGMMAEADAAAKGNGEDQHGNVRHDAQGVSDGEHHKGGAAK